MIKDQRDVFLSHASEDKSQFVRPFAEELDRNGISYWLDEAEIKWGDRITKGINDGLRKSKYVIVFLSDHFLGKNWPEAELEAALSKENSRGKTVVLPLLISNLRDVQDRYPLLQDKVCLQWSDGIPAIVRNLKGLLVEDRGIENDGKQMWDPKGVAIDLSHRQSKWGTFTTLIKNHPGLHFRDIEQGITKHELGSSSVLVVALPYHCEFTDDNEIQNIKDWVVRGGGLLLLGYYFADTHHESNPSKLARAFGLEFSNDLIMPTDRTSYRDCQDQAFEYDEALSVIFQLPSSHVHPIAEGVKNIAFLSACSIKKGSLPEPEYAIKTPLSSVIHPKGRPSTEGYLLQINEYVEAAKDAVTVLAAWQYGQGRLVASGTWKVATFAYGNNTILVWNILNWLSQPHAI